MNSRSIHNKETKVSQVLSNVYKFFHILLAIDFGFLEFKSYKIRVIYKFVKLIQALCLCSYLLYTCFVNSGFNASLLWSGINIYQYAAFVTCLTFHKNGITFYNFLRDLKSIDTSLRLNNDKYKYEKKMLIVIFIIFVNNSVFVASYYFLYESMTFSYLFPILYVLIITSVDVVAITHIFFYYAVVCRLNQLLFILNSLNDDFRQIQLLYKSIVDVVDKYKPSFDFVFLTTVLITVIRVMGLTYSLVYGILMQNIEPFSTETYFDVIAIVMALALTFGSALCAEMVTTQADRIKMILLDKQIEQQDEAERCEMDRFIEYVQHRGCRFRLYKVVPLNTDLLGMVLRFCVTYLIVIIQFTIVS